MRRKFVLLAALLSACVGAAGAAMVQQATDELVAHATLVVFGTVEDVVSEAPDADGIIYSEAKVRVRDTVVGASAAEYVTVRYTGGQYGDLALAVTVEPAFEPGEDVVLFLAPGEGDAYKCPDGVQSKLTVVDGTVLPVGKTLTEYLAEVAAAAGR
jgi:hypothetical protein